MRSTIVKSVMSLALAATAAATAITTAQVDDTVDDGPASDTTLDTWDYPNYDCLGSVMCGATPIKVCDVAVNERLHRTNDTYYGPGENKEGACNGIVPTLGCAVFVQGNSDCVRTGEEIWDDYQDIRYTGGCTKCGTKHWAPGCMTTINYVTWCNSPKVEHLEAPKE